MLLTSLATSLAMSRAMSIAMSAAMSSYTSIYISSLSSMSTATSFSMSSMCDIAIEFVMKIILFVTFTFVIENGFGLGFGARRHFMTVSKCHGSSNSGRKFKERHEV